MWQFSCTLQFSPCGESSETDRRFSGSFEHQKSGVCEMATKPAKPVLRGEDEFDFLGALPVARNGTNNMRRIDDLRLLWRRRIFVFRVMAAGLVLSTAIALLIPSRYTSRIQLMPPEQDAGAGGAMMAALASKASGSMGGLSAELLGLKTSGDLFVGVLKSRTVSDAVIGKCDLQKIYGLKHWDETRKRLASTTTISQDRKSGILTVEVSDHDARRAQAIAQEYVSQLDHVVTNLNTSSANRERIFLQERLKAVQHDLDSAQTDFSEFASKNATVDPLSQGKVIIESGAVLSGQLGAAQTELEGLKQIYAEGNVRVRAVQARVNELRRQLHTLGSRAGENPAADQGRETIYPSIRDLPRLGGSYFDLFRRLRVQEAVFETLTRKYELAKVQEAKDTPSVKVLDAADLPERKSFPPRATIIILGTIFSAATGTMCVIGSARWHEIAQEHPGKLLASGVFEVFRTRWPLAFRSGSVIPADESSARN
jgi:capsule polysaccharide export protein KpsE/RkpR